MKKYLFILALLLLSATQSIAAELTAASCSRNDVYTKYTEASANDTILIPAGGCDWANTYISVTAAKPVKFRGAGNGAATETNTVLTGAHTLYGFFKVATGADPAEYLFEVSNMRFIETGTYVMYLEGTGYNWRIHDNYFYKSTPNATINLATINTGGDYKLFGLFDNNTFYNIKILAIGSGSADGSGEMSWRGAAQWGTDQAVFIENNKFYGPVPSSGSRLDSNGGSRVVVRYNDFYDARIEAHSACESTVRGSRSYEVYNNNFMSVVTSGSWAAAMSFRAGSYVVTRNRIAGDGYRESGKIALDNRRSSFDSSCTASRGNCTGEGLSLTYDTFNADPAHPGTSADLNLICQDQIGAGTGATGSQTIDPVYIWSNVSGRVCRGGSNIYGTCTQDSDCPDSTCTTAVNTPNLVYRRNDSNNAPYQIVANRDYFEETERPGWTPYTCPHPLADPSAQGACATTGTMYGTAGYTLTGGESDTTAPTVTSAYIQTNGTDVLLNFSENITSTSGAAFTAAGLGSAVTLTCPAVASAASSMTCTTSRTIMQAEGNGTYGYTGTKVVDTASNALATIDSSPTLINLSTQNTPPLNTLTITSHAGATVTSSPSGINCGSTCSYDFDTGTVVTVGGFCSTNYGSLVISGACNASTGQVTMSEARSCAVTCTKTSPDVSIGSGATVTLGSGAAATIQ